MLPKEISESPQYESIVARRQIFADRARKAQLAFRTYTIVFIIMTAVAAIASGLVLYGIEVAEVAEVAEAPSPMLLEAVRTGWVRTTLIWIMAISLAVVSFCEFMNQSRNYGKRHVENRVKAETLRWERERVALRLGHTRGVLKGAAQNFLAFIDEQIRHASMSTRRFSSIAWMSAILGAVLSAVAAFFGAIGIVKNPSVIAYVALAGVCIPAITAAVKAWAEFEGGSRRMDIQTSTHEKLLEKKGESQRFRDAVEANDIDAASAYQEEVIDILKADLDGFIDVRSIDE